MPAKPQAAPLGTWGSPGGRNRLAGGADAGKKPGAKWANRGKPRDAKPKGLRRGSAMPARPLIMKSKPWETMGRKAMGAKAFFPCLLGAKSQASPAAD